MFVRKLAHASLICVLLLLPCAADPKKDAVAEKSNDNKDAVLWRDPGDISSRDLFYGSGGKDHQPVGPFVFLKEDLDGTNPKFSARDKNDVKWKVKMGNEARPETVASRIVWAVGYFTDEDYYLASGEFEKLPEKLHRGQKYVESDGTIRDIRLKREGAKKLGYWEWATAPFANTREWNGLRVLMALINNWDLKDVNNAIYERNGERICEVSDLGASFGSASRTWPKAHSKGDLHSYQKTKFITKVTPTTVSFRDPGRPTFVYLITPREYFERVHMEWIGQKIPIEDARWIGGLLARLSSKQIRDAFRAAGYSPSEIEGFASVLEIRVRNLTDL